MQALLLKPLILKVVLVDGYDNAAVVSTFCRDAADLV